jgi:hypothetical protein
VNFRALTLPETVFVGQQANYEVAVFLKSVVRDRLRQIRRSSARHAVDARLRSPGARPPAASGRFGCFDVLVISARCFLDAGPLRNSRRATRLLTAVVSELLQP